MARTAKQQRRSFVPLAGALPSWKFQTSKMNHLRLSYENGLWQCVNSGWKTFSTSLERFESNPIPDRLQLTLSGRAEDRPSCQSQMMQKIDSFNLNESPAIEKHPFVRRWIDRGRLFVHLTKAHLRNQFKKVNLVRKLAFHFESLGCKVFAVSNAPNRQTQMTKRNRIKSVRM